LTSEHSTPVSIPPGDIFATTHWTVVLAAGQRSTPQSAAALEQLCHTYWFPLYAYARRRGFSKEDAEDLTQEFFRQLLERRWLADADRNKGRLRAFLINGAAEKPNCRWTPFSPRAVTPRTPLRN
jgi:hypothetical protein